MAGATLPAENGGTFQVRKILPRPGGAVDLIVSYRLRGRLTTYSAYRREADGRWKALHGSWVDLDVAIAEVPHADRYGLLDYDPLRRFLARAIAGATVPVGGGPDIGYAADQEYRDGQADYDTTPNDEGDETQ